MHKRISKRSEQLYLALILIGFEEMISTLNLIRDKYYILCERQFKSNGSLSIIPLKNVIYIHQCKAKYHTSLLSNGKRIKVTKIKPDTLKIIMEAINA